MARMRTDGQKFEREVSTFLSKTDCFVQRLYTPMQRYSGIQNVSDFILLGKDITYFLECKETGSDSFSLYTMRQKDSANEVFKFGEENPIKAKYLVLVHFIKRRKFVLYRVDTEIVERQMIRFSEGKDTLEAVFKDIGITIKGGK